MRSMWKGSISFGLVNIPVSLYKATEDHRTSFRSLHEECKHPIQYKKWCPVCNREVERTEIIRGYEYAPGSYALITDDDISNLPLPTLRTIEILHFTDKENIDPIYYEKTYYLGPGEYGGKPYKLLYQAMDQTNKVAVAKVAFRTSEHLSVIRVYQNCLLMNIIHYPAEIRAVEEVPGIEGIAGMEVGRGELDMAIKLIEEISGEFRDDYKSNYEEALKELIEAKIHKQEVEEPADQPRAENVVDLMEALKRSLNANKEKPGKGTQPAKVAAGGEQTGEPRQKSEPKRRRRKVQA
ncbi:Ku protein [Paenactinomyces guangxiensis]|uniref:Non-homologous end joining protein Ku n=1 Tax=Paenactinomyces guangxiensis TaxID=1490290 RepID=A0A7W1WN03_9BACL|nr:Ku protein [Paenactinomyces guangxiensis]MBA4492748.1 Ku protein [Paenactinomyces guangxiensis]MBH8590403.1 Ku protein [Paenactinomyces guangxiensis]